MNSRNFLGLGLRSFVDEGLVDVGDDATASNCGLDQGIKLFIPSNGKLQMSRGDTLHTQITRRITSQLENLRAQIFAYGSHVDCRCCSNATVTCHSNFEVAVYTSHRKLNFTRKKLKNSHKIYQVMTRDGKDNQNTAQMQILMKSWFRKSDTKGTNKYLKAGSRRTRLWRSFLLV